MRRLPGDIHEEDDVKRMIRVNHAGEYGALRIYAGQLAVMKESPEKQKIKAMLAQEQKHFDTFDALIKERKVRPTALMPVWKVAGFALGAATALMGKKAAFACTVAVENVIEKHYAEQELRLGENEAALSATVAQFRAEELEHRDTSIAHKGEETPLYPPLSLLITQGSKLAIFLSKRI